ncbi:hypothetical protein [Wolbachia endosymbiont (group A) of Scambus nigricans]|uniref:hypothetical protein n=1 Tax=Wolbachia endosymbiont (group A) of Scambus nigricans TaxID=2954055 RepID=UPI0022318162|nr:hypothetical protein [Wolbachia endosymbiont (group A) of Scambus nigricans]
MLLACYSHKHISYRIRTIIRKAILSEGLIFRLEEVSIKDTVSVLLVNIYASIIFNI